MWLLSLWIALGLVACGRNTHQKVNLERRAKAAPPDRAASAASRVRWIPSGPMGSPTSHTTFSVTCTKATGDWPARRTALAIPAADDVLAAHREGGGRYVFQRRPRRAMVERRSRRPAAHFASGLSGEHWTPRRCPARPTC